MAAVGGLIVVVKFYVPEFMITRIDSDFLLFGGVKVINCNFLGLNS